MDVDPDESLHGYNEYRLQGDEDQMSILMDTGIKIIKKKHLSQYRITHISVGF